jgi:hypothetical protein
MGASLIRGRELEKRVETLPNGKVWFEIVPIEGDYEFPLYSSAGVMVDYAEGKGVERALWPIYYENYNLLTIEDVYDRCRLLKAAISRLSADDLRGNEWLSKVAEWLNRGERFCIIE